jgi:hypothetical protein
MVMFLRHTNSLGLYLPHNSQCNDQSTTVSYTYNTEMTVQARRLVGLNVAGMQGMGETVVLGTVTSPPHTAIAKCRLTQSYAHKCAHTIIGKISCHHQIFVFG